MLVCMCETALLVVTMCPVDCALSRLLQTIEMNCNHCYLLKLVHLFFFFCCVRDAVLFKEKCLADSDFFSNATCIYCSIYTELKWKIAVITYEHISPTSFFILTHVCENIFDINSSHMVFFSKELQNLCPLSVQYYFG